MTECGRQFLLATEYDTEGVNLSAIVASSDNYNQVALLHLADQHPPSDIDCGEDHVRCKNHLVVKNTVNINSSILFVALRNSLLLANFVSNDTDLTLQDYHLINLTHFNCSPITSLEIARSVYTICLNLEQSYLSLFEIRLNTEYLTRTIIVGPLARNYFELSASVGLSEFKYVELYHFYFIYFVYANYLYYFEPLEYTMDYVGDLHRNCSSVQELEYAGDDILIAHCRNRAAVYYNLAYGYRTVYQTYAESGRPYVCTNLNTRMKIVQRDGHIQINVGKGNTSNIQLMGEDFVSGECFGDNRGFYFAYIDQTIGTFVLDLATFNFTQLSNQSCSITNQECKPVKVLNKQYLVVHELANDQDGTDLIKIFDSQNNFQMVTQLTSTSAHNTSLNIVTILLKTIDTCYTTTVTTTDLDNNIRSTTTVSVASTSYSTNERTELYHDDIISNTQPPSGTFNMELELGLIAAGLVAIVILIVLTVIAITVQCYVLTTKWQTTYSRYACNILKQTRCMNIIVLLHKLCEIC